MVYLGACLIAGFRLARERRVNVRVVPTSAAIAESVTSPPVYNRGFRGGGAGKAEQPERATIRRFNLSI
jgi:hypothetical protein